MADRAQLKVELWPIIAALVIALVVGVLILPPVGQPSAAFESYQDAVEQDVDRAQAYCEQVYGSSDIYNAMAMGGHDGLHCEAGTGPHLHEIPEHYQQATLTAERQDTDLGWSTETAQEHASETAPLIPLVGVRTDEWHLLVAPVLAVGAVVVMLWFLRQDETPT